MLDAIRSFLVSLDRDALAELLAAEADVTRHSLIGSGCARLLQLRKRRAWAAR